MDIAIFLQQLKTKKKISKKTKAVITVPIWGYPYDCTETKEILEKKQTPLIEDTAQAHGARINNEYLGTIGEIGCFSTHDRKILSTGEGGFTLTNNEETYKKIKSFIQFGNMTGKEFGLNYKLSGLQAAIGLNRINQINKQLETREKNAEKIKEVFDGNLIELDHPRNSKPNYYSLVAKMNFKEKNPEFIKKLSQKGIPSDIIRYDFTPLYKKPLFSKYASKCGNSEKITKQITTIPVHPGLTPEEINYIRDTIKEVEKTM